MNSDNQNSQSAQDLTEIKINQYGDLSKEKADIIIWSPHDGGWGEFLKELPEFMQAFPENADFLTQYLKLERDNAANELSEITGQELATISQHQLRIDVLTVTHIPRGICDLNRLAKEDLPAEAPEIAVRHCFNHQAYPELLKKIQDLHQQTLSKNKSYIHDLLAADGIFIDFHTMDSHNYPKYINESSDSLKEYFQNKTGERDPQQLRSHCLLTKRLQDSSRLKITAKLANHLQEAFLQEYGETLNGVPSLLENDPYELLENRTCNWYFEHLNGPLLSPHGKESSRQGISIDVARGHLTQEYNSTDPEWIEPEKPRLAKVIALGIWKAHPLYSGQ